MTVHDCDIEYTLCCSSAVCAACGACCHTDFRATFLAHMPCPFNLCSLPTYCFPIVHFFTTERYRCCLIERLRALCHGCAVIEGLSIFNDTNAYVREAWEPQLLAETCCLKSAMQCACTRHLWQFFRV